MLGIGLAVLVVLALFSMRLGWPFFIFFLPLGLFNGLFGRRGQWGMNRYAPVFWGFGLLFLLATHTIWPGIIFLWLLWLLVSRW